jgi:hypothetical protein
MARERRLSARIVDQIAASGVLRIRAGDTHRFLGIWAVVVDRRVFVRSWTLKKQGWNHALRDDPRGAILIADQEVPVRARHPRSERLLSAIDRAYREKYLSPGSRKYAVGLTRGRRRASTTELIPR